MPTQLTDAHAVVQGDLADQLGPLVAAAADDVDPHDLRRSLPVLARTVTALRFKYGKASQALALAQYRMLRADAGLGGMRLDLPDFADVDIERAVAWAYRDVWGPGNVEPITVDGKLLQPFADRLADAVTNLEGVVDKLVLDAGRDSTLSFVDQDVKARGYARVPEADCCAFCALLSTRGPVYKSAQTARFKGQSSKAYHNKCRCQPEPVWFDWQPSQRILDFQTLYSDSIEYRQNERPRSHGTGKPLTGAATFRRLYDAQGGKPLD